MTTWADPLPPKPALSSSPTTAEMANLLQWYALADARVRHEEKLAMDAKMVAAQLAMVEASKTAGDGMQVADVVALIQAIAGAVKP